MEIKKGESRIVFIFKRFVIKIPIIQVVESLKEFRGSLKYFFKSIRKYGFKRHYLRGLVQKRRRAKDQIKFILRKSKQIGLEVVPFKSYEIYGVKFLLLSGIMTNWNEYIFYQKTKNLFVIPTYFSLFGLINISKKAEKIDFWSDKEVFDYIWANSANANQVFCDSHSFAKKDNFGLDGNKLKMLDYGSIRVHNFLRINGDKLFSNFIKPPV